MKKREIAAQLERAEELLALVQQNAEKTDEAFKTPQQLAELIRRYFATYSRRGWCMWNYSRAEHER